MFTIDNVLSDSAKVYGGKYGPYWIFLHYGVGDTGVILTASQIEKAYPEFDDHHVDCAVDDVSLKIIAHAYFKYSSEFKGIKIDLPENTAEACLSFDKYANTKVEEIYNEEYRRVVSTGIGVWKFSRLLRSQVKPSPTLMNRMSMTPTCYLRWLGVDGCFMHPKHKWSISS
jgi:hypothetical protein